MGSRHPSHPDQNNKGLPVLHSTARQVLNTPDLRLHHRRDHPDPNSEARRGHRKPDRLDHHSDRRRDCASMDLPDRHRPDRRGHCRQAHRDRNNKGRPGRHSLCSYRYRWPGLTTRTLPAPGQSVVKGFSCCPLRRKFACLCKGAPDYEGAGSGDALHGVKFGLRIFFRVSSLSHPVSLAGETMHSWHRTTCPG